MRSIDYFPNGTKANPAKIRLADFSGNHGVKSEGLGLVRQSGQDYQHPERYEVGYGLFRMNRVGDGDSDCIRLTYKELVEMAKQLPALIESGRICEYMTKEQQEAAYNEREFEIKQLIAAGDTRYISILDKRRWY